MAKTNHDHDDQCTTKICNLPQTMQLHNFCNNNLHKITKETDSPYAIMHQQSGPSINGPANICITPHTSEFLSCTQLSLLYKDNATKSATCQKQFYSIEDVSHIAADITEKLQLLENYLHDMQ